MIDIITTLIILVSINMVFSQVPVIKSYTSEITLKVGDDLRMECPIEISSDNTDSSLQSSIMYEWKIKQLNDVSVAMNPKYQFNHNAKTLNITKPVNVEDSGSYVCKGITGFGSKEAVFNVKVVDVFQKRLCAENVLNNPNIEPPCFLDPQMRPGEIVIRREAGSYVEFSCQATGTRPLKYLWFFGNTIANWIQTAEGVREPILSISNVKLTYSGQYTCQVTNQAGSLNYTYRLIVTDSPNNYPRIITDLTNYTLRAGEKASISVEIECECKSPIIKWLKRVETSENSDKDNLKGLTLPNAKPSEKGELYITLETGVKYSENTQSNIFESQLIIHPLGKQDSGKYIVMTMNKNVNFKNFEYRAVYLTVESDKRANGIKNNLVVYVAVPIVILISSLAVIIYCCFRRHSPGYGRSSAASRSSHQCGNGSALPSFTNGSNTGSEKIKSPSTASTGAVPAYNQYKYMYPPQAPSSTYDQYSVLSVSNSSQTNAPQYFQPNNAMAVGQFTNPYLQGNGYVPVSISHYPA